MEAKDLSWEDISQIIEILKEGKIGVMPTDTIYGIVGSALNHGVVEEIYALRKRSTDKPFIILISSLNDLRRFSINLSKEQMKSLKNIWPNPISFVLPCPGEESSYLHRGKNSLAFRMPKHEQLLKILQQAGPLVAPSANIENNPPAEDINQARNYFGDKVAFYIDGGTIKLKPSKVIRLYEDGSQLVLRK